MSPCAGAVGNHSSLDLLPSVLACTSQDLLSPPLEKDGVREEILIVQVHSQGGRDAGGWVGWKEREEGRWTRAPGLQGFKASVIMILAGKPALWQQTCHQVARDMARTRQLWWDS